MDSAHNEDVNPDLSTEISSNPVAECNAPTALEAEHFEQEQQATPSAVAANPSPSMDTDTKTMGEQFEPVIMSENSDIENMPVIKNWQPAPGFSALGVLAGALIWIGLAYLIGPLFAWIVQTVFLAVYIIVFYRSYFTANPRITSSKAISFLNYATSFSSNVVSVFFGWCWNRNLKLSHETKVPKMGISYIVAIVYFCLMIGLIFWYESTPHFVHNSNGSYTFINQPAGQNTTSSSEPQNGKTSSTQITNSHQASIPSTKTQVTVPTNWNSQTYGQEDGLSYEALLLFPSYASKDSAAFIMAWDASEYGDAPSIHAVSEEAVLERNRMNMDSIDNETASLIEINGVDYWKAVTEGTYSGTPMKDTSYYCCVNSILYQYTLSCLGASDIANDSLNADFESIVTSADYR